MIAGNNDHLMSDINVTPFVDVMLVLLIIFMVTAPMMVQGVDVALPQTTAEALPTQKENLIITIDSDGQVYINTYPVALDSLKQKLDSILKGRSDREVYLRADKQIPYGNVVRVMAAIKDAGVEKLGMVTIPVEEQEKK
ncbi:MAG: protein TolR [Pseudomonadota bacterium]